jgi:uncharacterized protein
VTAETGGDVHVVRAFEVKSIDRERGRVTAWASTAAIDRDGEVILPEAFKKCLPGYLRNPVILAGHNHRLDDGRSPVVAKCIDAQVNQGGLLITVEFAPTALGQEYRALYEGGYQKAFSVGFIPKTWEDRWIDVSGQQKRVRHHTEVELLEISCVPVPSNPEALSRAAQRKREFVAQKRREHLLDVRSAMQDSGGGVDPFDPDQAEAYESFTECPADVRKDLFTEAELEAFRAREFAETILSDEPMPGDNDDDWAALGAPDLAGLVGDEHTHRMNNKAIASADGTADFVELVRGHG